MPKFDVSVTRRMTTYERFSFEVEAASEDEVRDKFANGDDELMTLIGDHSGKEEIDDCDTTLDDVDLIEDRP